MKQNNASQKGFTLVELIITIAIFAIVGALGIQLFLSILTAQTKITAMLEVQTSARLAARRMAYEIRRAMNTEASTDFGVNLATTPGATLDLDMPDAGRDPTTFDVSSGVLRISQGAGSAIPLTSNDVEVTNLTIYDRTSVNGRSKNIKFTLTVSSNISGLNEPNDITITTTVEMRHP